MSTLEHSSTFEMSVLEHLLVPLEKFVCREVVVGVQAVRVVSIAAVLCVHDRCYSSWRCPCCWCWRNSWRVSVGAMEQWSNGWESALEQLSTFEMSVLEHLLVGAVCVVAAARELSLL